MEEILTKVKKEHNEIYTKLDFLLHELTKVKKDRDDEHLLKTSKVMLDYVKWLLWSHFKDEERDLFPVIEDIELKARLIADHQEIELKYNIVVEAFKSFDADKDYKEQLLFPAYNLIATINHHAQREDRAIFNQTNSGD